MILADVVARRFEPLEQAYDERDSALYGVSLGMGSDPLDEDELPFVFEGRGLRAVPSLALTLGWPAFWQDDPATGIDWMRILHGEQHLRLHRPLPAQGRVRATHCLAAVEDKGAGRGALIHFDIELHDATTGDALASLRQVQFLRGDGGCGSWGQAPAPCAPLPVNWQPEQHIDYRTTAQAALLYRLASRDLMPLHADPRVARLAGFDRPISHGLNNLGLVCRALLKHLLPGQPERLRALSVRFAQPSFPGETIRIEWRADESTSGDNQRVRFRAMAVERQVLLMDRGLAEIALA